MIFIALVAVAVWLADLRLAVALPVVALAWVIAAAIEYFAWRSAGGPVAIVDGTAVAAGAVPPPVLPVEPEPVAELEAEPEPIPDLAPPEPRFEPPPPPPEPEPEPEPEAKPEPEPEAEPGPPAEPEAEAPSIAVLPSKAEPEGPESRWARRKRLRAVPPPPAEEPAAVTAIPAPPAAEAQVVALPQRSHQPRQWNIWDLERLARAEAADHPERRDEWAFLFVHLRQFANADGALPSEFDSLVRESFGGLLDRQPSR